MNLLLGDRERMVVALEIAAYMRWLEIRTLSSNTQIIDAAVRGVLDREKLDYSPDEIKAIAILAAAFDLDVVHSFIESSGIFNDFDQTYNQIKQT